MTSRCMLSLIVSVALFGCGDDGGSADATNAANDATATGDAASSAADATSGSADAMAIDGGNFTLTSSVMTDGGDFPVMYTCAGTNVSPPLAWTGAPAGTMAYALVFLDTNNGLIHSVMWDIPSATMSLPENVEKVYEPSVPAGAKQTRAYSPSTRGYLGPCPGKPHLYRFTLHAVDVATLPGLGMSTTRMEANSAIEAASIATATLEATYDPG